MVSTVRYKVRGRVQGVWFRASTQAEARRLGLGGWVRNCDDGSVEAVASGNDDALKQFYHWLNQGPPHARVYDVEAIDTENRVFGDFEIRDR